MSKEVLLQQIAIKAETEAKSIIDAAERNAEEQKAKQKAKLEAEYQRKIAVANEEAQRAVANQAALIRLNGKKSDLNVKRDLIDEVYRQVKDKIVSLSDKDYRTFIAGLIKTHAEDGDEVLICRHDSNRLSKVWLDDLAFDLQLQLSLSKEFHGDVGGIILRGKKYDKNMTVSAIIAEVRDQTEHDVANRLFG